MCAACLTETKSSIPLANRTIALYSIKHIVKPEQHSLVTESEMDRFILWIEREIEFGVEEGYYFVRAGKFSIGIGSGIFGTLAMHLETPLALIALEI